MAQNCSLDFIKNFNDNPVSDFVINTEKEIIEVSTEIPPPLKILRPSLLKITYTNDLDIFNIHNEICKMFSSELFDTNLMLKDIDIINKKIQNDDLKIIEIKDLTEKKRKLEEKVSELKSGEKWFEYIYCAKPLLEQYNILSKNDKNISKITFKKSSQKKEVILNSDTQLKLQIISDYIEFSKNYIDIDCIWEGKNDSMCENCGNDFKNIFVNHITNLPTCSCGASFDNIDREQQFEKPGQMSGVPKIYNSKANFEKTFHRYQGIVDSIPDKLFSQLDNFFIENNFSKGEEIRNLPLDSKGKKKGTSIKLLQYALSQTNNSEYYYMINAITYTYWGWKRPEIEHLKDYIMDRYEETQKVYETYKTRKSCLNVYLHLYQLLRDADYPCELEDFKILTTEKSIEYHTEQFKIISEKTGMKLSELY